jgi:hypothetical protein
LSSPVAIRAFLAGVRIRLRRRALARAGLYLASAAIFLAVAAPLVAGASGSGRAIAWIGALAALTTFMFAFAAGLFAPRRRWRSDRAVAAYIGRRVPRIGSDLLSAVELNAAGPARAVRGGEFSPALITALTRSMTERLGGIAPAEIVSRQPLWRPVRAAGVAAAFAALVAVTAPGRLAHGWRAMLDRSTPPGSFGGAAASPVPLVGDLEVTLHFPRYTRRDIAVLANASGELRVVPGTRVRIDTTALEPASAAWIAFDEQGEKLLPLEVTLGQLGGEFEVRAPLKYRFLLQGPDGLRRVESTARSIEIEPDTVPRVELHAPGEELDVTGLKRIELAYVAEDDYGLSRADLVWDGPDGKPRRMPIELPRSGDAAAGAPPPRSAQNKLFWDLADVPLQPGVRIAYHVEVFDNDEVNGPKAGHSKTFTLRVLSPRERHERLIELQRELFEKMVRALGGRLTIDPADGVAHEPLHRDTAGVVVELGTAAAALGNDRMAAKQLVSALGEMRGRLDRLVRREARLLKRVAAREERDKLPAALATQLGGSDRAQAAELEEDVLLLADWLDRQDLENLLAINDEIKNHRERLDKLFAEYQRTKSPEIRAEIERELRALEQRLAELERRSQRMPADVLDQFVNTEAMRTKEADDCLAEVRRLFASGDVEAAQRKMRQCAEQLDQAAAALEQSLDQLRGDRFSEQQKKFEELRSEIADLAGDQQQVAGEADELQRRYAEQAKDLMREAMEERREELNDLVGKLRRRVAQVPESGLGQFVEEETSAVKSRVADIERLLADGDLAEALAMAREAEAGLETVESELGAALEEEGRAFRKVGERGLEAVGRALPVARKLVGELEKATPPPSRILDREDLERLERLSRRQQALEQRANRLAQRSREMADELPGESGTRMSERLGEAGQKMDRAAQRMRARDPSGARQEAREAAEKLAQAKEEAQGAARQRESEGRSGLRDEPVRIPGADEYRAPERFREDILDAMKKDQAPTPYREMVKRYYEELIR